MTNVLPNRVQEVSKAIGMNDQEKHLYQTHLNNLWGSGGVDHPESNSRSSVYQAVQEKDGKFYNIPTVWDGKIETDKFTRPSDGKTFDVPNQTALGNVAAVGWDKFPSYGSADEADSRYDQMHSFMEQDTANYMNISGNWN